MRVVEHIEDLAPLHHGALVPTMGALHAGHGSLIERAVAAAAGPRTAIAVSALIMGVATIFFARHADRFHGDRLPSRPMPLPSDSAT